VSFSVRQDFSGSLTYLDEQKASVIADGTFHFVEASRSKAFHQWARPASGRIRCLVYDHCRRSS
jgi:hypothetical protein